MLRVALTGGIATGKSHVRARLDLLGAPTIDADELAREVVAPGSAGLAAVVECFGTVVLDPDGALDRRVMAAKVFADDEARRALEAIVHPLVLRAIEQWFTDLPATEALGVADIPLLFETGRERDFDAVIVTACAPDTQILRIMSRDGLSEAEARQRVRAQLPLADKVAKADYVILTDGPVAVTDARVREVHGALVRAAAAKSAGGP
ncbi:MAG: dephospho-CoA kinase [Acidimicrobiia bacterium]|nr:dephospho-CoA kinase [Acidimicrobiia bacterium]